MSADDVHDMFPQASTIRNFAPEAVMESLVSTRTARATELLDALDQIQLEQFEHDEKYHREIARLGVQDRIRHIALHFAKYAGNLLEAEDKESTIQRIVSDVFVMSVSCANTLNVRLREVLPDRMIPDAGDSELVQFATTLTISAGRMAAACEKLDHLEDYPFRPVVLRSALTLVEAAIRFSDARDWDLKALAASRLARVKEKSIFHGKI